MRRIALVIDGMVYSTPLITGPVNNGIIVIASRLLNEGALDLMSVLNAGALPAPLVVAERHFVVK